jgi:hypothetical protein
LQRDAVSAVQAGPFAGQGRTFGVVLVVVRSVRTQSPDLQQRLMTGLEFLAQRLPKPQQCDPRVGDKMRLLRLWCHKPQCHRFVVVGNKIAGGTGRVDREKHSAWQLDIMSIIGT